MRFCVIVEERYRFDGMPLDVARQLEAIGHDVDLLEPQRALAMVSEIALTGKQYDAFVLKTVSDGPGLSILDAASATGHMTINRARAIRLVRNKAVAAAVCRNHDIPSPLTYFAAGADLVTHVPREVYPIVVKPANGSSGQCLHLVDSPDELSRVSESATSTYLLAQPYAENSGMDVKLYCIGDEVFTTLQPSPLHPRSGRRAELIDTPNELRQLVETIGHVFGLDVFGVDVVDSPEGPVVVDVNDFPSFRLVPDGAALVADWIVRVAARGRRAAVPRCRPRPPSAFTTAALSGLSSRSVEAPR